MMAFYNINELSTGAFGYPFEEGAEVALKTVLGELSNLKSVKKIRFVIYDEPTLAILQKALQALTAG